MRFSAKSRLPLVRGLTIAGIVSIGLTGWAEGATSAVASAPPMRSATTSGASSHARPQPHPVTAARHQTASQTAINPTPPPCDDQWNVVPSVNSGLGNNALNSLSALSGTDAYAVGDFLIGGSPNVRRAQAQHWDGTQWTNLLNQPPAVGTGDNVLLSVSAVATNNVWAVGFAKADNNPGTLQDVLIEHFDGTAWTAVADTTSNNPAGTSNLLLGVKAFSSTDIWAVGESLNPTPGPMRVNSMQLIEHFDGTNWTVQTGALLTSQTEAFLVDVLPLSATDVWAVGGTAMTQGSLETLVEHYDGTRWQAIAPIGQNPYGEFFNDIAGVAGDLWAVGEQAGSLPPAFSTLTAHYDGTTWTVVDSPTPDLSASLSSVRYTAANDVWAVGSSAYRNPGASNELDHSVVEHWDGGAWKQVTSPNPAQHQALSDIAFASPSTMLTVGFSQAYSASGFSPSATLGADLCEPVPAVAGLDPNQGSALGGTSVKIAGTVLSFPRSVKFGALPASSFLVDSATQITAIAPAQPLGTVVNVSVTTMGGLSVPAAGNQYTYVFGPGPWEGAGGVLASGPAASTWGSGRLDVFVTGADGILYHRFYNGTSMAWEALPGVQPASDASSVSTGIGLIDVFVRGSDGALWHRHFTNVSAGSWSPWEKLGGMITGAPAAVSVGAGNLDVFVEGTDNHLWYDSLVGTAWTWHLAGGQLGAPPAAVSGAIAGQTDAFVMGTDSALWRYTITSTTTSWAPSLGGRLAAKPAATVRGTAIDVFVEGLDAGLWHWSTQASGGSWEGVGGRLAGVSRAV